MSLKIYNSFTRKKEEFKPIEEGKVKMYVCGPTVYGHPHVGHARSYTNFDTIRRYFEYLGFKVKYVQNITDVGHLVGDGDDGEDKVLKQAKKENLDPYEIAYKYESLYFEYMDKLNIKRPSISARATGYIPEMLEMIKEIIKKGYAYVTKQGNVYLSVRKVPGYGKLSGRKLDETLSGERIDIADDKEFPEDAALWKSAAGGHIMKWPSPWGEGYPGWHIECSAISKKLLGKTFDIHGGGLDNIFPHHETEIAQSEVCNGCRFVNYFMHNNLITVNGKKMGKSLGNFITLEDLFKNVGPMALRFFIMQFHYRKPVDFSNEALMLAKEQYDKLSNIFVSLKEFAKNSYENITNENVLAFKTKFEDAMNDDFNTPVAIAEVLAFAKFAAKIVAAGDEKTAKQANSLLKVIEYVLGFEFKCAKIEKEKESDEGLMNILSSVRDKLRAEKNFAMSDFIRDELAKLGTSISDKKL